MAKDVQISLFFPAYNEEKNIKKSVEEALLVLPELASEFEVIVVDDGSRDKTAEIVKKISNENKKVRLFSHPKNLGYGSALKTGFEKARFPWVAFADSDGQFDIAELGLLIEKAGSADLVLGYRLNRADPFFRSVTTFGWKTLARILLGLDARDYSCGFKLIKKEVYKTVLPLVGEEKVTQIELLVKAKRLGFKIAEVGVHHYPRKYGSQTGANLSVVLKSVADLFKLWRKLK
jgi:glycosyltransferase involved in cell wall biosynthesis